MHDALGALVAKRKDYTYQMPYLKTGTSPGPPTMLVDRPHTFIDVDLTQSRWT